MKVRFEASADEEFQQAVDYLRQRSPEAADGLLAAFVATRDLLLQFPHSGSPLSRGLRKMIVKNYPYKLIYRVDGDEIRVFAFAHDKRRPGYWRKRLVPPT